MNDLARPLDEFIDWAQEEQRFIVTGARTDYIEAKDLNHIYRQWCDSQGRARMNAATLANELPAAYPQVQHLNTRLSTSGEYDPNSPKRRLYTGIKLIDTDTTDSWIISGTS